MRPVVLISLLVAFRLWPKAHGARHHQFGLQSPRLITDGHDGYGMPQIPASKSAASIISLLGVGFACLSILAFEILSTRLLSVVLVPNVIILAIAIAMLGLGSAASIVSSAE